MTTLLAARKKGVLSRNIVLLVGVASLSVAAVFASSRILRVSFIASERREAGLEVRSPLVSLPPESPSDWIRKDFGILSVAAPASVSQVQVHESIYAVSMPWDGGRIAILNSGLYEPPASGVAPLASASLETVVASGFGDTFEFHVWLLTHINATPREILLMSRAEYERLLAAQLAVSLLRIGTADMAALFENDRVQAYVRAGTSESGGRAYVTLWRRNPPLAHWILDVQAPTRKDAFQLGAMMVSSYDDADLDPSISQDDLLQAFLDSVTVPPDS